MLGLSGGMGGQVGSFPNQDVITCCQNISIFTHKIGAPVQMRERFAHKYKYSEMFRMMLYVCLYFPMSH